MATLNFKRLSALPGVLEASTVYLIKSATPGLVDITITGNDAGDVRHVFGSADVQSAIDAAISALTPAQIPDLPGSKITSAVDEAKKLSPGATINGVAFDGSAPIEVSAVDTETPRVPVSALGDTVATLVDGKIPASQLPNGLDNIETFDTISEFPETGADDVLYIAKDTNQMYRWSAGDPGQYILIPSGGGTADVAVRLATARRIELTGGATGSAMFDGSQNAEIEVTIQSVAGSKVTGDIEGNAGSATKLKTAFELELTGDVTGTVQIDGSGKATLNATLATDPVSGFTGTATKVTVENGLVKSSSALVEADIPDLSGDKITSAVALAKALDISAEW